MRWWGLVLLAATPLQWFVLTGGPGGLVRLHQVAMLGFAALVLTRFQPRTHLPLAQCSWPFLVGSVYLIGITIAVQTLHGGRPVAAVKDAAYLVVFVAFGTYVFLVGSGRVRRGLELLRWSALVAACVFLVAMTFSMLKNGVSPVSVVQQAIATADPEVIQKQIFKSSFGGYGYDPETVLGNLRHEIFGAILLSMYTSSWAVRMRPVVSSSARVCWRLSMVLCVILLTISMSRSILIAAAVWPLIGLLQYVRTFKISYRQMLLLASSAAGLAAVVATGIGEVLWVRFTEDTGSYDAREGLYSNAFTQIRENFLFGGVSTVGQSSHNFVIDSWLRGGVFAAIAAAAVLLTLVIIWARLLYRLPREPDWMVPIAAAMALPIDRMLTAGGGMIPPVEWLALGLVFGGLALSSSRSAEGEHALTEPGVVHSPATSRMRSST